MHWDGAASNLVAGLRNRTGTVLHSGAFVFPNLYFRVAMGNLIPLVVGTVTLILAVRNTVDSRATRGFSGSDDIGPGDVVVQSGRLDMV